MQYRKFEGDNWLGRDFMLRGERYAILSHRVEGAGGDIALASEGRKAVVYKLRHSRGTLHALKVFHKKFALFETWLSAIQLTQYAKVSGLSVCDRKVLLEDDASSLREPGLEFAVLMPWMPGKAWAEIVADRESLSERWCIALARRTAEVLAGLEGLGLAHADISSSNVFVVVGDSPGVELIDVEDMYHRGFLQPAQMPAGTPGYNYPPSARTGSWNVYGDRFAAAILLTEMLTWHQPGVRAESDEFSYFHRDEMCKPGLQKYRILADAVKAHSNHAAELLRRAWQSSSLDECPSLGDWRAAIAAARPATRTFDAVAPRLTSRFPIFSHYRKPSFLQTELLSNFVCFECGRIVRSESPDDHATTCPQHPAKLKSVFKLDVNPETLSRVSGPGAVGPTLSRLSSVNNPLWKDQSSACPECGSFIWGDLAFMHKSTCSRGKKPAHVASTTCDECGNSIIRQTDHRPVCSKHPEYARSRPSRFSNVRFMPLVDAEPGASPPPSLLANTSLPTQCPECKKLVLAGSAVFGHGPLCSRRR